MSYGSASAALLTDSENQHGAARNDCIARTKKLGFHKIAGWPRLFHGFDTLVSRFVGFSLRAPDLRQRALRGLAQKSRQVLNEHTHSARRGGNRSTRELPPIRVSTFAVGLY
jgi:hypothetical protein